MSKSKENKMEYVKIDKESSNPLHYQIYSSIKDAIQNKRLLPGDKLPTEEELCQYFNISRPVVRQAYNKLIEEEFINRHKGKGSFVLSPKTKYTILQSLHSLTEQITMNNMNPTIKEYLREIIDCPLDLLEKFNVQETFKVLHIKRIYLGDNEPQFYIDAYFPYYLYKDIIPNLKENESIRDYTKKIPSFSTLSSNRHLTAIKFTPEICEYFNINKGSVGFKIDTTSYLSDGTIVEYMTAYIKGLGTRMTVNYF